MTDAANVKKWERDLDNMLGEILASDSPADDSPPDDTPALGTANPPSDEAERSISVRQLRIEMIHTIRDAMRLSDDIYDEEGTLLLAAGMQVTPRFVQLLKQRGMKRVLLKRSSGAQPSVDEAPPREDLVNEQTRILDELLEKEQPEPIQFHPVKAWRRPRLSLHDLKDKAVRGAETHSATAEAVADACNVLASGKIPSLGKLTPVVSQFVDMVALDFDLLPLIVSMQSSEDEYLFDHCVNVAMMSTAIASQLGLSRERVAEIGLAGLLQDIGMLRVPEGVRLAPRSLSPLEMQEIHRHPLHTLEMLAGFKKLPESVRFVAYQVHERGDGSGYPKAQTAERLHPYTKIVSIADAYAAMTRPRPHREASTPYDAAKKILKSAAAGQFDREIVRALLDCISLFPVGSRVTLNDGSLARVVRANPGLHTRPVVEMVDPEFADDIRREPVAIIDLSAETDLRVVSIPA